MTLGCRIRLCLAVAIAGTGAGTIALASSVEAGSPELLPDLVTLKPVERPWLELRVNKKHAVLRVSNRIGNRGKGPLEVFAGAEDQGCTAAGEFQGADLAADQRVFADTNGSGKFERQQDTDATVAQVGCFEYHPKPGHQHWHFHDFSQYKLLGKDGQIRGDPSNKIGFCIVDNFPAALPTLPGAPSSGFYPADDGGCGNGDPEDGPGRMGLSVGYADTYSMGLPGQRLPVTGVPTGRYCLVSTANPDHAPEPDLSQLREANPDNNVRRKLIKLNPGREKVKVLGKCPQPTELSSLEAAKR
jgi:hypothetical protein